MLMLPTLIGRQLLRTQHIDQSFILQMITVNLRGHREKGVKRSCKFFSKIWVGMFQKGQRIKRDTNSEDPEVRASDVFSVFLYFLQQVLGFSRTPCIVTLQGNKIQTQTTIQEESSSDISFSLILRFVKRFGSYDITRIILQELPVQYKIKI